MKNILLIIIVLLVITAGVGLFAYSQKATSQSDSMMKKEETIMEKGSSRYVVYSKANLEGSANTRRVLFFYANWCPICKPADANFRQNESKIPSDATLIRVNYNDSDTDQEEKDLARKYGITYQHTFVQIDQNDNVVTQWNGGQIDELLSQIR